MKSILLLVFLAACGGPHEPRFEAKGFEEYVEYFEQMSYYANRPTEVTDLIIEFGDVKQYGKDVVGMAFTAPNTTPIIWIDKAFWESHDDCARLSLIMHEMGHAIFLYEHRNNVKSVMNSFIVWDYCKDESYYVYEFFGFGTDNYRPKPLVELDELIENRLRL